MISMRIDRATAHETTFDNDAVRIHLCRNPEFGKSIGHHLDAITLLDPELFSFTESSSAMRAGGGDKQHRKFIDCQRHQFNGNINTAQRRTANANIGNRFAADIALILQFQISTHQLENIDHTGAGRVDADMLQRDIAARAIEAATMKNAAEEISAGTSTSQALSC